MIILPNFFSRCNPRILKQSLINTHNIVNAFSWFLTPQGFNYWHDVANFGHRGNSFETLGEMIEVVDRYDFTTDTFRGVKKILIPTNMAIVVKHKSIEKIITTMGEFQITGHCLHGTITALGSMYPSVDKIKIPFALLNRYENIDFSVMATETGILINGYKVDVDEYDD